MSINTHATSTNSDTNTIATSTQTPLVVERLDVNLGKREVLHDVSFTLNAGEFTALIGPNGAGKTTLLRSILGLVPPVHGTVHTTGKKQHIGYVPQRHEFAWDFPITVREAVLGAITMRLGVFRRPRPQHRQAVAQALQLTALENLAQRPVGQLSGGQRQRVLVARALALEPNLLLLDEPFTGLDMPTQEQLTDIFRNLAASGCAVLMTTHDLIAARATCDRLILLNGRVRAQGTPSELCDPELWIETFQLRPNNPLLTALGFTQCSHQ